MWPYLLLLFFGEGLVSDAAHHTVSFPATVYPSHFNQGDGTADHHLMVYRGGRAARAALVQAEVADRDILRALEALGGVPGDNLTAASWLRRHDPESTDPDLHVEGTPVTVTLQLPDGTERPLESLLVDEGGAGFSFRLGGHARLIPLWRSGCVVCLQSCPGGRISNDRYTMRDLAKGRCRFRVREDVPPDGTKVTVIVKLLL